MAASEELARRVVEAGRSCSLTTAVLEEWSRLGTPKQVEYLAGYLEAERSSREASKRATLLRRCALPAPKTFDGYDWSAVSWPEGMGRESLLALDFVGRREDLVLMGDVGTGKTHMASALCALACERRLEARFFTASSLVMRLRRARDDGRLDREAALIGKARLLVIDELGFLPLDADGARLLFQVFADAYERQSVVITTNLEFSRWGSVFGDDQMAAAEHRPHRPPREARPVPRRVLPRPPCPHAGGLAAQKACALPMLRLLNFRCSFCSNPLDETHRCERPLAVAVSAVRPATAQLVGLGVHRGVHDLFGESGEQLPHVDGAVAETGHGEYVRRRV